MAALAETPIDISVPQKVTYCVEPWLRDLQIQLALQRGLPYLEPCPDKRTDPVAIVCFGPSLNDTWEQLRDFKYIITCSGAHKFLVDRGVIPTWHCEVDPRPHKVQLIGAPHKDVEYIIAAACHPKVFDHLADFKVTLWHIFDNAAEGQRILPPGAWALTGGSSVGLRAMHIARFIGFTDLHIFGMDGNEGKTGKHADIHPNQPKGSSPVAYEGRTFRSTPALAECARQTFHEIDALSDVKATFYGEGLVQEMAKNYTRKTVGKKSDIAFSKPHLISAEYIEMNRRLHQEEPTYGINAAKYVDVVRKLSEALKTTSILDYGCGKGMLGQGLPFPIWEYDPAIPGKEQTPKPADIVCCLDVLEHIEPERLDFVLDDLRRCVKQVGFFVISQGAAKKQYPNGKNTHLIQEGTGWWRKRLERFFKIGSIKSILIAPKETAWDHVDHCELQVMVGPKPVSQKAIRRWHVLEFLAKKHGWTKGVEVGVKEGFTLLHLLGTCPNLHMTGVDLFEPRPGLESEGGESHIDSQLPEHEARLRKMLAEQYPERSRLIKGASIETAAQFEDGSLDMVFIDADHREEAVLADIAAWRPKIRPGGMLTGHDAQDKFPGVLAAINAACPGWKQYDDSVWSFQL